MFLHVYDSFCVCRSSISHTNSLSLFAGQRLLRIYDDCVFLSHCFGVANGAGVGVIKNADGTAYEYYGHAVNGVPEGAGYMIVHSPSSSYALEGQFSNGQANGVMRVAKSGQSTRKRLYKDGRDAGSATGPVNSPFAQNLGGS